MRKIAADHNGKMQTVRPDFRAARATQKNYGANMTKAEAAHIERVKNQDCAVCGQSAPSDAHHVMNDRASGRKPGAFLTIPLCKACHQGPNGIHGDRALWKVYKISEMEALEQSLNKIYG